WRPPALAGHRGSDVPSALTAPPAFPAQHKNQLRRDAKERRQKLAQHHPPPLAGGAAARPPLPAHEFPPRTRLSAYWAMGDELDGQLLIRTLHERGCTIGLPVVVAKGQPLVFRRWTPETRFIPGGFNTQVPGPEEPEIMPERLIVPLLAFDSAGYRLG